MTIQGACSLVHQGTSYFSYFVHYFVIHASLLPCTCNAVFYYPSHFPYPPPPLSLLSSCICTCYAHTSLAHTSLAHTYMVVTTHTQAAWPICVPCTLHSCTTVTHYLLMHSLFVCSTHMMYALLNLILTFPCVSCYVYVHRDTNNALNM